MLTYNPITHAMVDLSVCEALEPVTPDAVPVRVSGTWMVHAPYTNTLCTFESAWEALLPSDRSLLKSRVKTAELIERVEQRIAWTKVLDSVTEGVPQDSVLAERFGTVALHATRMLLRRSHDRALIEHALATIDSRPTLEEVATLRFADDGDVALDEGVNDKHALKAVFVAGSGGSGKSSIADLAFAGEGFKTINQDRHLERFLKANDVPLSRAGSRYDLFRNARELKNKEQSLYSGQRLGLVIDSTGWDYKRIAEPVADLAALGYDTYMIFVTTSLETALARNASRGASGGRSVPGSFVQTAWEGAHDNLGRFRRLFGRRFYLIDNDDDMTAAQFDRRMAPIIKRAANKILAAPITNPIGKKWIESGGTYDPPSPKTPTPQKSPAPKGEAPKPKEVRPPRSSSSVPRSLPPPAVSGDKLKDALAAANARLKSKKFAPKYEVILPSGNPFTD